jgi:PAS domain-containing protein
MPDDVESVDRAVLDLRTRLASLRDACASDQADPGELLEVALHELDRAAAEAARAVALLRYHAEPPRAAGERERDRELLRRLFLSSPAPTLLLSASGDIRRGNRAAGDLFHLPLGYLTGKPFFALLDPTAVALTRARLDAARHRGERQALPARIRRPGGPADVAFTIQPFAGPGSPGPDEYELIVVATDVTRLPEPARPDDREGRGAERSRQAALSLDLAFSCASALLEAVHRAPKDAERLVAEKLAVRFADWVLVDRVDEDRSLRRTCVSGPAGQAALGDLLCGLDPDGNLLARTVLGTGEPTMRPHPHDPDLLGTLPDGRTVIGAIGAGSLLAVPFGHEERVMGVLSAVRTPSRGHFTLTDQRVLTEIAALLGLALAVRDLG